MFDYNTPYQLPIRQPICPGSALPATVDMADAAAFEECLGKNDFYADYLTFFEKEIASKGMRTVVKEYVLQGDERADDIFCRMFTGASSSPSSTRFSKSFR